MTPNGHPGLGYPEKEGTLRVLVCPTIIYEVICRYLQRNWHHSQRNHVTCTRNDTCLGIELLTSSTRMRRAFCSCFDGVSFLNTIPPREDAVADSVYPRAPKPRALAMYPKWQQEAQGQPNTRPPQWDSGDETVLKWQVSPTFAKNITKLSFGLRHELVLVPCQQLRAT